MKRLLFRLLYLCGVPAVFRYRHRNSLTVVLYHGVAPREDSGLTPSSADKAQAGIYNYRGKFITPGAFERQLAYFQSHYSILSLEDALTKIQNDSLPPNALVITFDDGYRNFYTHAYPELKARGIPATMYLATDFVCRSVPLWVDRLEYAIGKGEGTRSEKIALDAETRSKFKTLAPAIREHDLRNVEQIGWTKFEDFNDDRAVYQPLMREEIIEMQTHGISFGAHTKSHPILATQTADEQRDEIEGSRRDLELLGVQVSPVFAYPNGQRDDWNTETETVLTAAGFTHGLTTLEGVNTRETHPQRLHRFTLDATEDIAAFANIVSGVRLFLKSFRQ